MKKFSILVALRKQRLPVERAEKQMLLEFPFTTGALLHLYLTPMWSNGVSCRYIVQYAYTCVNYADSGGADEKGIGPLPGGTRAFGWRVYAAR